MNINKIISADRKARDAETAPTSVQSMQEVVDLLGQQLKYAQLRGRELYSLCPFHDDQHVGSFSVNVDTGLYYCYSCKAHGGPQKLLREVGVPQRTINEVAGDIDFSAIKIQKSLQRASSAKEEAVSLYRPLPESILDPLVKGSTFYRSRGHSPEVLSKFEVHTDPVRHRTVFPLRNCRGGLTGFQTRSNPSSNSYLRWKIYRDEVLELLKDEEKGQWAGYTPPRNAVLYNEHVVFPALLTGRLRNVVLVEGPGHALRVSEAGLTPLGTLGTHFGPLQLTRLRSALSQAKETYGVCSLTVMYDADDAGKLSALASAMMLQNHANVRLALLPEGEDPEDLSKESLLAHYHAANSLSEATQMEQWKPFVRDATRLASKVAKKAGRNFAKAFHISWTEEKWKGWEVKKTWRKKKYQPPSNQEKRSINALVEKESTSKDVKRVQEKLKGRRRKRNLFDHR